MHQLRSVTLNTERPRTAACPGITDQPFTAAASVLLLSPDFRVLAASPGTAAWLGLPAQAGTTQAGTTQAGTPRADTPMESVLASVLAATRDCAAEVTDRAKRFAAELDNAERTPVMGCLQKLDGASPCWLLTLESSAAADLVGEVIRDATFAAVIRRLRPKVIHDLKGPAQTLLVGTRILQKALSLQPGAKPPLDPQQAFVMMEDAIGNLMQVAEAALPEPHGSAAPAPERLDAVAELRDAVMACEPVALPRGIELHWRADPAALIVRATRAQLRLTLRLFLLTAIDLLLAPGAAVVRAGRVGERLRITVMREEHANDLAAAAARADGVPEDLSLAALAREKTREGLGLHVLQELLREQGGCCDLVSGHQPGLMLELPLTT